MNYLKTKNKIPRHFTVLPFISSVIIPLVITDIWIEIYHRITFPLYGLPYIKRNHYIKIDRHHLKYLTLIQKIYCTYCGYANGVMAYWVKIAGETEKYWCGIKHNKTKNFIAPAHHQHFAEYNNYQECKLKYGVK